MNIILILFSLDHIAFRNWFKNKTVGRLVVVLLFLTVFSIISAGLYAIGNLFFGGIASYEQYGLLTSEYIIHASIIIILWLSLASAMTSSIGLILVPGIELNYLLSLPVKTSRVIVWLFTKSVLANFILMSFVFLPIMSSYAHAFKLMGIGFIIRTLISLLFLVILSSSVAMPIAIFTASKIRSYVYQFMIVGMLGFFIALVSLLKLVFPPSLSSLILLNSDQFHKVYLSLPLNQNFLPTLWLTRIITTGFSLPSVMVLFIVVSVMLISVGIQTKYFWNILVSIKSLPVNIAVVRSSVSVFIKCQFPVLYKDFLQLLRDPGESGYALFLSSVAIFFFAFLRFGTIGQIRNAQWQGGLILFTYAWLIFFAISLYLRFVFPLLSREFHNAGALLSLPLDRKQILFQKLLFSLILTIPLLILSSIVFVILPFTSGFRIMLISVTGIVLIVIVLSQLFIGFIGPDFREGDNPEKISTSGIGIATLVVSVVITFVGGYVIREIVLSGSQSFVGLITGLILVLFALITGLYSITRKTMNSYQI